MTPETAIGLLKHHINTWAGKFPSAHFEACELAAEAFEKQIPKERIDAGWRWECPACNEMVEHLDKYCKECGQRLYWGDFWEEEEEEA